MTAEEWGIIIGMFMSISILLGPWMFKVHAKLAVIASRFCDLCDRLEQTTRENRKLWEISSEHDSRLDSHDVEIMHLKDKA